LSRVFSSLGSARAVSSVPWGRFCSRRVDLEEEIFSLQVGGGRGSYFSSSNDEVTDGVSDYFYACFGR